MLDQVTLQLCWLAYVVFTEVSHRFDWEIE